MACGKPVVAYDIENMRGIIHNGTNGILVDENEDLESGIPQALKILPENCTAVAKEFCWENHIKKFLENQASISHHLWT